MNPRKKEIWDNREEEWMKPLRDAGFTPVVMNSEIGHCRVTARVEGTDVYVKFDFWPTTLVWIRVIEGSGPTKNKGHGCRTLIGAIRRLI